MFVILSCKTATTPIASKRSGTYVSAKQVNGSSYLAIAFDGTGGFELYYSTDETGTTKPGKVNKATAGNISGEDPNYTFQTGEMAGTLYFISDNTIQITVTFNDNPPGLNDVLCYKKN